MKQYFVVSEDGGILNPGERPFRSLEKARLLCAKEREACSWKCMTDGEDANGRGNFRCGTLSPHGIAVHVSEDGRWVTGDVTDDLEPEPERLRPAKTARHVDWHLNVVVDRGTGYLADGDDHLYFAGPEMTEDVWQQKAEDHAAGDDLVEWTVNPVPHGRFADRKGDDSDYPMRWSAT